MTVPAGPRPPAPPLFPEGQAQAARWAAALPAVAFGRAGLSYYPETGSTQDQAFAAVRAGAAHGVAFVAERQTAGRGRRGAEWLSPPSSSLLLSAVLRPAPAPAVSGRTALAAAAAACRAIESAAPPARAGIKWPNDLLVSGRKAGGILLESRGGSAVLGIGINVLQRREDFPPGLQARSTSLAIELGAPPDRRELLAALLTELGRELAAGAELAEAGWERLRAEIDPRLAWRGRLVRVRPWPGGSLVGRLAGLDRSGGVILEGAADPVLVTAGSLELAE